MSDHFLRLVPSNPDAVPTPEASTSALNLLKAQNLGYESVHAFVYTAPRFIDAGENWDGVKCPACGADVAAWWTDAMDTASNGNFLDLSADTPCCRKTVKLNELNYGWPVAFGRYVIQIANPDFTTIPDHLLQQLQETLGYQLRTVSAHV